MDPRRVDALDPSEFKLLAARGVKTDELLVGKSVMGEACVKAIDADKRTIDFIISGPTLDRDNDIISLDGWDLVNYKQNPVVLWAHNNWDPPIARSLSVGPSAGWLKSTAEFPPQDLNPFAFMVFQLYAAGYMRAVSVGFKPMEWSFAEDRKFGVNFIRQELLEYSCCPVPSNPDALADAKSKGLNLAPMASWCERHLDDRILGVKRMTREDLEQLRSQALGDKTTATFEIHRHTTAHHEQGDSSMEKAGAAISAASKKQLKSADAHLDETITRAKAAKSVIKEMCGADDDGDEGKAGATFSAANKEKLKAIVAHGQESGDRATKAVKIAQALHDGSAAADDPDDDEAGEDGKSFGSLVKTAKRLKDAGFPDEARAVMKLAMATMGGEEVDDAKAIDEALAKSLGDPDSPLFKHAIDELLADELKKATGKVD